MKNDLDYDDCPYPKPGSSNIYDSENDYGRSLDREVLHPGINERLYDFLVETYPGEPIDPADLLL